MLAKLQNIAGENYIAGLAPAAWFRYNTGITVTGSGVSQWDDQSGNARHLKQGTDANRPVALLHTGTNYLYLPGASGNSASTSDSSASSVTGSIDVRVCAEMASWTAVGLFPLVTKDNAYGTRGLFCSIHTGHLRLIVSADGVALTSVTSTASVSFGAGQKGWVRYTKDTSTGVVTFYTSADGDSWTQLGNTVASTAEAQHDNSNSLYVGAEASYTYPFAGKIYRAIIKNGIDGTTVVDFNAADATDQAASFASRTTGETWTVNTSGAKPAQIVGSSRLLGDGSNHKMACDTYTANQPRTIYALAYGISWTAADYLCSGVGAEAGITQVTATPQIGLNAGSAAAANGDFALSSWKVICAVINGASSSLQVNNGTAATGNAGANNPAGLTLFSNNAGSGYFNGMIKELIDFPTAHDATQRARVISYLGRIGGLAL